MSRWLSRSAGALALALSPSAVLGAEEVPRLLQDDGPQLRRQIAQAQSDSVIILPKRVYHFFRASAPRMNFYVSNHDQRKDIPVGLPFIHKNGVTLDAQGSTFIFHGDMQPVHIQDCSGLSLRNVTIRYADPFVLEAKVCGIDENKITLRIHPGERYCVQDGNLYTVQDEYSERVRVANAFYPDGSMVPSDGAGDIAWDYHVEQLAENLVQIEEDASSLRLEPDCVLVLRSGSRPHPALLLYRAKDVTLKNVIIEDSQGMGLLAQRSEGISFLGGGCIRRAGRYCSTSADATHFSNCRGKIVVKGALFEGMMDDAINVHSTCLAIERVENSTSIVAKYMHYQSVGFEVFSDGERVQFVRGKTLENVPELGCVKKVEMLDEQHVRLIFEAPVPEGIGEGDAVENADWYPSVEFVNNTVRYNRARGALFTTPKPVLVKDNKFVRSHGSAILLAGDAQDWYESGACNDVKIIGNLFDHNLTASYQFTDAVIAICPEVRDIANQKRRYHRNILIEGNTFRTHHVPLLSTRSAENVTFNGNKVLWDDLFQPRGNGCIFIINEPAPQKIILQNIHP